MALPNRAFWALLALAPIGLLTEGSAAAAEPLGPAGVTALPHGIHLGKNGRYYQDVCDHDAAFYCLAKRLLPSTWRPGDPTPDKGGGGTTTTPPAGTMAPSDVLAAYSIPTTTSAGGKIVAIEDMPYTTALADVNVYRAQYGIPALAQCSGAPTGTSPCFAVVDENGNLNPTLSDGGSADTETSLDMDMISAACGDCSILLVEFTGNGPSDSDFVTAAKSAATLGAVATSISWGGEEGSNDPTGYTQPGKMLVLAASGDSGYLQEGGGAVNPFIPAKGGGGGGGGGGGTPGYPASSPDVLGIGGTNLQAGTGGAYTEVVWDDQSGATTSGCSTEFATPTYQTTFLGTHASAFGSCAKRATNDVSAAAEFTPSGGGSNEGGIAEYSSTQGGWGAVVGTSAATPEVAAILTRLGIVNDVSNDLGYVYTNIASFNDVTSGTNASGGCTPTVMCTAGAGWDGPTGVGTPNGAKLLGLSSGSSSSGSSTSSSSGSSTSSGSTSSSSGSGTSSGSTSSSSGSSTSSGSSSTSSGSSSTSGSSTSSSGSSTSSSSSGGVSSSSGGVDAGAHEGGAANGANDLGYTPQSSGCGCTTIDSRADYGAVALGIGLAAGLGLRRRRSRT